jgi:hypothetical protein
MPPIFTAALAAHGLAVSPRPLGAVATSMRIVHLWEVS